MHTAITVVNFSVQKCLEELALEALLSLMTRLRIERGEMLAKVLVALLLEDQEDEYPVLSLAAEAATDQRSTQRNQNEEL